MERVERKNQSLNLQAQGTSPADSAPLVCSVGDRRYEAEITMDIDGSAEGGLLLFYNHKAYVGVSFNGEVMKTWQYAEEQAWSRTQVRASAIRVRVTNDENVITWHYSTDGGKTWVRHPTRMEVGGLNHNTFGGFLSLKIGLCSTGDGAVRWCNFIYRALQQGR